MAIVCSKDEFMALRQEAMNDMKGQWKEDRINEEFGKSIVRMMDKLALKEADLDGFGKAMLLAGEVYGVIHSKMIDTKEYDKWLEVNACLSLELAYRMDAGMFKSDVPDNMFR